MVIKVVIFVMKGVIKVGRMILFMILLVLMLFILVLINIVLIRLLKRVWEELDGRLNSYVVRF